MPITMPAIPSTLTLHSTQSSPGGRHLCAAQPFKPGDTAKLTFDAIPDLALTGKVLRIKGFGENRQGDIVYKVVVQPDTAAAQLRWNMTSTISISGQ